MTESVAGFDWDTHNIGKCQKHGVALDEIETLFADGLAVRPDIAHSNAEERFQGIGRTRAGRHIFVVFTIRFLDGGRHIRPVSARYMHDKEVTRYAQDNPAL
jgi:uncharacterized protein